MGWDTKWRSDGRLQFTDHGVEQHESLCRTIHLGLGFDGLNAASLASFELSMRELMMIEERHKERFAIQNNNANALASERSLFLGLSQRANLCILPALIEYVGSEVQKEQAVMKERRNAREERELLKTHNNKNKNKNKHEPE